MRELYSKGIKDFTIIKSSKDGIKEDVTASYYVYLPVSERIGDSYTLLKARKFLERRGSRREITIHDIVDCVNKYNIKSKYNHIIYDYNRRAKKMGFYIISEELKDSAAKYIDLI